MKSWNSTLSPISKKRLAQGVRFNTLKRTPLRPISKKTSVIWNNTRNAVLNKYGRKCFLCGRSDLPIHIHHFDECRSQNPSRKYDIDNLVPLCAKCHQHTGCDKQFYVLREKIRRKLENENNKRILD